MVIYYYVLIGMVILLELENEKVTFIKLMDANEHFQQRYF
jgi:hypothetical protein